MSKKKEVQVNIDSISVASNVNKKNKKLQEKKSKANKRSRGNRVRLLFMLILTFGYFLVEIIVGYMTNSVALVADSFHMLSDVISLIIAYAAIQMSPNKWARNTFGWARAEVLGALVNSVFLMALCFTIVIDSLKRFIEPEEIKDPKLILIVGSVGLGVNLIGLVIFHEHGHSHKNNKHASKKVSNASGKNGDKKTPVQNPMIGPVVLHPPSNSGKLDKEGVQDNPEQGTKIGSQEKSKPSNSHATQNLNMRGVFLHVLADALGSVIVIISALVIWLTKWKYNLYVDPSLSLIVVILIMCSVWPLFVESAMVLLQTVPTHIQIDALKKKLLSQVDGIYQVHECHIWSLSGDKIIVSAHILCNNPDDFVRIGKEVKEFFHNEGIHSTTIQLEWANQVQNPLSGQQQQGDSSDSDGGVDEDRKSDCFLTCPFDDEDAECVNNSCCGVPSKSIPLLPPPSTSSKANLQENVENVTIQQETKL